jgi:hypothetical protein
MNLKSMKYVNLDMAEKGNTLGKYDPAVIQKVKSEQKAVKRAVAGCDVTFKKPTPLQIHLYSKLKVQVLKTL